MQPTASKAWLLKECAYPFGGEVRYEHTDPTEPMRYGNAFHAAMAHILTTESLDPPGKAFYEPLAEKWGVKADELEAHVTQAAKYLAGWLVRNPFDINFTHDTEIIVEQSFALSPAHGARGVPLDEETHMYGDLAPYEIGGTADLIMVAKRGRTRTALILDHKTGMSRDFSHPETDAQLLTLAMAVHADAYILAFLHTPRRGLPNVYAEHVPVAAIAGHARIIHQQLGRVGDGSLRPGAWCRYCPARSQCPAKSADLLAAAGELVEKANLVGSELVLVKNGPLSREEKAGRLHMLLQRFRELDKRAVEELKRDMRENPDFVPFRPDGKALVLKPKTVESLSKASIVRALGKVEGEKLIAKLRELGCVESTTRIELHVD